jgi:CubicO group peptidase (beta-lactamase class C family)
MDHSPTSTAATQTRPLSATALLAVLDSYVATVPESNGYIAHVWSLANGIDVSVASGLSDVATNTAISAMQPSRIASVTKTFTAASVLRLVEMNKLSLHDAIEQHASPALTELLRSGGYDTMAITVKHLLQHASGIADYAGSDETYQGAFQKAVLSDPLKKWTRHEQVAFAVNNYGPVAEPGQEFHYCDTGYILLGDIIEQVTQQTYGAAMRSLLSYEKLGLDCTYLEDCEPIPDHLLPQAHAYAGEFDISLIDASYDLFGGGGLVSTVQDVSKFFAALFDNSIFERASTLDVMLGKGTLPLKGSGGQPAHMSLYPRMIGSELCLAHSGFTGITVLHCPRLQTSITFTILQANTPPAFHADELLKDVLTMISPPSATSDATSSSSQSLRSVDGLWRSDGYGYVLKVDGVNATVYEETTISCVPVSTVVHVEIPAANPAAANSLASASATSALASSASSTPASSTSASLGGGPIRVVRSTSPDSAQLTIEGRVGLIHFNRIDRLPETYAATLQAGPLTAFDVFAKTFAEHYPFFANRNVDWSSVTQTHRARVSSSTTDAQLANIFADMIEPLGDAHTNVVVGESVVFQVGRLGSTITRYDEFAPFLERVASSTAQYLGVATKTWGHGLITYADLPDGIGYLRLAAFDGFSETGHFDDERIAFARALDAIFANGGATQWKGLILDIRVNGGGSDELALQLAGHLTDVSYRAYAKQARNDAVHPQRFTAAQVINVQPSLRGRFTGPVVVLTSSLTISAGETFTQAMLNRKPAPIRIGQHTQGVFSDVLQRHLPMSTVSFGLPNENFLTEHDVSFDRFGIPPDIAIATLTESELAEGTDAAMDMARRIIASGEAVHRVDLTTSRSTTAEG